MEKFFKNVNHKYLHKIKQKNWILGTGNFTDKVYQTFKAEIIPNLHKLFQKIEEDVAYLPTWPMVPAKHEYQNLTNTHFIMLLN